MKMLDTVFEYCQKTGAESKEAIKNVKHGIKNTTQDTKRAFKDMDHNVRKAMHETKEGFRDLGEDIQNSNRKMKESFKHLKLNQIDRNATYIISNKEYDQIRKDIEESDRSNNKIDPKIKRLFDHINVEKDPNGVIYTIKGEYII